MVLVWEETTEEVVEACKDNVPILIQDKDKQILIDKELQDNILIEGDNYHSLSALTYSHQGKVDFIYADPPYNTGNNSMIYNNKIISKEDGYRHSKWTNFMFNRLKLSRRLLNDDGVILVTIDHYELGALILLMDEIFGERCRMGIVAIEHNPRGRGDDLYFATSSEFALIYSKNPERTKTYKLRLNEKQIEEFMKKDDISYYRPLRYVRSGSNSTVNERPNLVYKIFYDEKNNTLSLDYSEGMIEILPPLNKDGIQAVWRWGKDTFNERKDTEIIAKLGKDNKYNLFTKDRIKEGRKPKTIWHDPKYDASSHGTKLLEKILGKKKLFDYPKSLFAVKDFIEVITREKKNAIILDFFAGSGTTGHAVLELNKEDEGKRKYILCTNNENNIAENVCYQRLKNVINGYKPKGAKEVQPLPSNLRYFKTKLISKEKTDLSKKKISKELEDLICIKEDFFNLFKEHEGFKVFIRDSSFLALIFDMKSISEAKKILKDLKGNGILYIFSLSHDDFKDDFEDLKNISRIENFPTPLIHLYNQIHR
jgi:adenine-specific DNA-methyltransferase